MGNASRVSKTLREAGLPKASAYRTWGHETDGFMVFQSKYGDNVGGSTVAFSGSASFQREQYERAQEVLAEAGFTAVPYGRPGVGGTYGLEVRP
jgi:hypothetical protein